MRAPSSSHPACVRCRDSRLFWAAVRRRSSAILTTNYIQRIQTVEPLNIWALVRLVEKVKMTFYTIPIWGYTPFPWSGGCPVDIDVHLQAEQPLQSYSHSRLQVNSSGCWFSQHNGQVVGSADRAAPQQHSANTMQLPNERPYLGVAAQRSQFQGVLEKKTWNWLLKTPTTVTYADQLSKFFTPASSTIIRAYRNWKFEKQILQWYFGCLTYRWFLNEWWSCGTQALK